MLWESPIITFLSFFFFSLSFFFFFNAYPYIAVSHIGIRLYHSINIVRLKCRKVLSSNLYIPSYIMLLTTFIDKFHVTQYVYIRRMKEEEISSASFPISSFFPFCFSKREEPVGIRTGSTDLGPLFLLYRL